MPNQALALARAAAQRVLRRPSVRELVSSLQVTPAAEPVAIETVTAAPQPTTRAVFIPPPRFDPQRRPPTFKRGARVDSLRPEMTRIYGDVADSWADLGAPDPVITSGHDSHHMRGSRHYDDLAFDLRGNNIDAATAQRLRDDLARRIGDDYQVIYERFPDNPGNNHIHVEYDPRARR